MNQTRSCFNLPPLQMDKDKQTTEKKGDQKSLHETTAKMNLKCKIKLFIILLESQDSPVHPGLQSKHVPFCMSQALSLQSFGHGMLQVLPYTPGVLHP